MSYVRKEQIGEATLYLGDARERATSTSHAAALSKPMHRASCSSMSRLSLSR